MSLGGCDPRFDPSEVSPPSPRLGSDSLLAAWLMRLGPVLLVQDANGLGVACRFHSCAIDSFGVRETLHLDGHRIHRLADSDYYGWEHIAALLRAGVEAPEVAAIPAVRRAHVVRSTGRSWQPVTQLSALGWRQVDEIVRRERARLEPMSSHHAIRWRD
jgi:hypothetical protein